MEQKIITRADLKCGDIICRMDSLNRVLVLYTDSMSLMVLCRDYSGTGYKIMDYAAGRGLVYIDHINVAQILEVMATRSGFSVAKSGETY